MRILVSNDDGVYSPGIHALARIAQAYGDVRVVAPDVEQSAMSHAITVRRPLHYARVKIQGLEAYKVDGTPADCVALGTHHWDKVDLVLTGINLGLNIGHNIWHSGTVAAAKQASFLGIPAIAFSAPSSEGDADYGVYEPFLKQVIELFMSHPGPAPAQRQLSGAAARPALDEDVGAALRGVRHSRRRPDGPDPLLVHRGAARARRGGDRPLGHRAGLRLPQPAASRPDRRRAPRGGARAPRCTARELSMPRRQRPRMTFAAFRAMVAEMVEEIPPAFMRDLQGVHVIEEAMPEEGYVDVWRLGEYLDPGPESFLGAGEGLGRHVALYYGSFVAVGDGDPAFDWEEEAWETLTHELRHHVESLAGDGRLVEQDVLDARDFPREER
jgi:hypothetical protein